MSPHETPKPRTAFVERNTKETSIQVSLSLDGQSLDRLPHDDRFAAAVSTRGQKIKNQDDEAHHAVQFSTSQTIWVWTGIGFLDHMLHAMAKHAGWSLRLRCRGDLSSMGPCRLGVSRSLSSLHTSPSCPPDRTS